VFQRKLYSSRRSSPNSVTGPCSHNKLNIVEKVALGFALIATNPIAGQKRRCDERVSLKFNNKDSVSMGIINNSAKVGTVRYNASTIDEDNRSE